MGVQEGPRKHVRIAPVAGDGEGPAQHGPVHEHVLGTEVRVRRRGRFTLGPRSVAVGDAQDIIHHLRGFVAAGAYKFVLRPIADGDADIMAQTRLLIDEVLPEVYSAAFEASARS